jgi:hypothetical protein
MYRGISAPIFAENQIITVPYSAVSASEEYYFNRDATFIFFRSGGILDRLPSANLQKILRVLFKPDLAYSINSTPSEHETLILAFFTQLFLVFVWLIFFLDRLINSPRAI